MGLQAIKKIFNPVGIEEMTAEQEKAMKAYIKEQQDGGSKWKKGGAGARLTQRVTRRHQSAWDQ
jgi:hypothetical protein